MADAPINEPEVTTAPDAQAALELRIDEELGLPKAEIADEASSESTPDEGNASPAEGEATGEEASEGAGDNAVKDDVQPEDNGADVADPVGLFITVQDAAGKDYKITKIEDLPEDFTPKNNRQVIEILSSLSKLESDTVKAQADAETKAHEAEAQAQQQAQLTSWDGEIDQLQKEGRLDKPKAAPGTDGFKDDPVVKKVDAVFKFMADTNDKRAAAGNPNMIRSFEDALDKYELVESKKAAESAEKDETKRAKDKAALIGGTSAPSSSEAKPYFAGSASSIWDV